jgi:hypothetical protein
VPLHVDLLAGGGELEAHVLRRHDVRTTDRPTGEQNRIGSDQGRQRRGQVVALDFHLVRGEEQPVVQHLGVVHLGRIADGDRVGGPGGLVVELLVVLAEASVVLRGVYAGRRRVNLELVACLARSLDEWTVAAITRL